MKFFGYGGQQPMTEEEILQEYAALGIGAGPAVHVDKPGDDVSDLHLANIFHSEDGAKREDTAESALNALRHPEIDNDLG